jgi:hypothetical protein
LYVSFFKPFFTWSQNLVEKGEFNLTCMSILL